MNRGVSSPEIGCAKMDISMEESSEVSLSSLLWFDRLCASKNEYSSISSSSECSSNEVLCTIGTLFTAQPLASRINGCRSASDRRSTFTPWLSSNSANRFSQASLICLYAFWYLWCISSAISSKFILTFSSWTKEKLLLGKCKLRNKTVYSMPNRKKNLDK